MPSAFSAGGGGVHVEVRPQRLEPNTWSGEANHSRSRDSPKISPCNENGQTSKPENTCGWPFQIPPVFSCFRWDMKPRDSHGWSFQVPTQNNQTPVPRKPRASSFNSTRSQDRASPPGSDPHKSTHGFSCQEDPISPGLITLIVRTESQGCSRERRFTLDVSCGASLRESPLNMLRWIAHMF